MDNIIIKPLGLVLIVTAHVVFNDPSKAEDIVIIETLGRNITLSFTFSDPHIIKQESHVAVYVEGETKIAECGLSIHCSERSVLGVEPNNNTVLYHITNLKRNDSNRYWATVFVNTTTKTSNTVRVDVRQENKTSTVTPTVPPMATGDTLSNNTGSSGSFSLYIVTVLVVSPVVLLVAGLLWVIWCLVRTKDKQPPTQQNSNPTVQETIESSSISPPSVIYSILDFPKRPSAVLEINPNDTEYAAVGYLSEMRIKHS